MACLGASMQPRVRAVLLFQVSGFSFAAYSRNALLFEGASALPVHWNSLRSSMAERLVLWGDFHRLAHAQKVCGVGVAGRGAHHPRTG